MDSDRFDTLARSLTGASSRRRLLVALLAGAVGRAEETIAKPGKAKGHRKGKAKGKAKGHSKANGRGGRGGRGKAKDKGSKRGGRATSSSSAPSAAAPTAPSECTLSAEICDGCCQDGQCLPGTDHGTCGHSGMACQNCTAQAMRCTGDRICDCNSTVCAGCCVGGVCQTGDRIDACGRDGIACRPCPTGYVCRQGRCCGDEGTSIEPAPAGLAVEAQCCAGLLTDSAGICRRGCDGFGCQEGELCQACQHASNGAHDTCIDGRCCLMTGSCPCGGDGPCRECCSGRCEHGGCRHDCSRWGCPDGNECCPSTGECFSHEQTNCRRSDGSIFQCEAGLVCCQAPDGRAECGGDGLDICTAGFVQALPAICPEWIAWSAT